MIKRGLTKLVGSRGSIPRKLLSRFLKEHRVGVNYAPGHVEDGWTAHEPVSLADGSEIELMKDGEMLKRAYDQAQQAQARICFEFYIWENDDTGRAFAELLIKKAREGVIVYAMYDSFGSISNDRKMFAEMKRAGVRVAEFHPIRPWESNYAWRPYCRDHRKVVVVDDHYACVGGLNLANVYAGSWVAPNDLTPNQLWRDTGISIYGKSSRQFLSAFIRTWNYIHGGGRIVRAMHAGGIEIPRSPKGFRVGKAKTINDQNDAMMKPDSVGVLATVPTLASPLRPLLHQLIRNAKRNIRMTMAYFAPDDELISALCEASLRGVQVQLMFGAKSDLPIMVTAARAFYERMMAAGIEIYERQHVILHAKTMTVDDQITIIGSTNLDYRSIEFNLEISAVVRSEAFAGINNSLFEHDVKYARKINPESWRRRPWRDRFVQWFVSRMRYLL